MILGDLPSNLQDKLYMIVRDLLHGLLHQQQHQYVLFVLVVEVVDIDTFKDLMEEVVVDLDGKIIFL
jgi:hypothetical protein